MKLQRKKNVTFKHTTSSSCRGSLSAFFKMLSFVVHERTLKLERGGTTDGAAVITDCLHPQSRFLFPLGMLRCFDVFALAMLTINACAPTSHNITNSTFIPHFSVFFHTQRMQINFRAVIFWCVIKEEVKEAHKKTRT